jgi:hypothetical protein
MRQSFTKGFDHFGVELCAGSFGKFQEGGFRRDSTTIGRSLVIASKASATETIRPSRGISVPPRPIG